MKNTWFLELALFKETEHTAPFNETVVNLWFFKVPFFQKDE